MNRLSRASFWQSDLLATYGLRHGVTERGGGQSAPPFDSLNLAFHVGDRPEDVLANRERFCCAIGVPLESWVVGQQVHDCRIRAVDASHRGRGGFSAHTALPRTDGLVTVVPDLTLVVLVADCAPVFVFEPNLKAVALLHVGWQPLVGGIVELGLAALQDQFGVAPAQLVAAVGPCIGPCCFEVSSNVADQIAGRAQGSVVSREEGKWSADLHAAIRTILLQNGMEGTLIEDRPPCTCCNQDRFFSYRSTGGVAGRMAAFVSS